MRHHSLCHLQELALGLRSKADHPRSTSARPGLAPTPTKSISELALDYGQRLGSDFCGETFCFSISQLHFSPWPENKHILLQEKFGSRKYEASKRAEHCSVGLLSSQIKYLAFKYSSLFSDSGVVSLVFVDKKKLIVKIRIFVSNFFKHTRDATDN